MPEARFTLYHHWKIVQGWGLTSLLLLSPPASCCPAAHNPVQTPQPQPNGPKRPDRSSALNG